MKKQLANLFTAISKQEVENLTTQVSETVAIGFNAPAKPSFGSVDLWNIYRQRRSFVSKRSFA